jgi:hypothetical protein
LLDSLLQEIKINVSTIFGLKVDSL